ncbi:MAG TPA: histidinol-phosphatase, partial [Saprospiraceae bacterium]|nr:histidinol-phosphatase [Saprospiraceae bacterium]
MVSTKTAFIYLLGLVVVSTSCRNVDTGTGHWYKGNLHTHSYWSDGDDYPEMIMDWYQSHGYQFVALSEHNIIADHEKWVRIGQDSLKKVALNNYRGRFGDDWVVDQLDENGLAIKLKTLEEYRPIFEEPGKFLIIQSEEITNQIGDKPLHLNATNLRNLIEPQQGESVVEILQKSIDAVQQQREETDQPMIIHLNHPNFHYAVSLEDMIALRGEQFFEVFNGHPQVHNQGDSVHIGTEEMWDLVNIAYLRQGKPMLYALGTDDSHNYHRMGRQWSNSGRGWVMVYANELTPEAIIEALEAGSFYASTGVT